MTQLTPGGPAATSKLPTCDGEGGYSNKLNFTTEHVQPRPSELGFLAAAPTPPRRFVPCGASCGARSTQRNFNNAAACGSRPATVRTGLVYLLISTSVSHPSHLTITGGFALANHDRRVQTGQLHARSLYVDDWSCRRTASPVRVR